MSVHPSPVQAWLDASYLQEQQLGVTISTLSVLQPQQQQQQQQSVWRPTAVSLHAQLGGTLPPAEASYYSHASLTGAEVTEGDQLQQVSACGTA